MLCDLILIPTDRINLVWPTVAPLIAAGMHKMDLSDFDVLTRELHKGAALLWVAFDGEQLKAAAATQVTIVHGRKHCTIIALGGKDRRQWLPLIEGLEDYARAQGCAAMRMFGRAGWSRTLPNYQIVGHIIRRNLQ